MMVFHSVTSSRLQNISTIEVTAIFDERFSATPKDHIKLLVRRNGSLALSAGLLMEREREREDVNVIGGAEARHCVMEQEQASKRRLTSPDTDVTRSRTQVCKCFKCVDLQFDC